MKSTKKVLTALAGACLLALSSGVASAASCTPSSATTFNPLDSASAGQFVINGDASGSFQCEAFITVLNDAPSVSFSGVFTDSTSSLIAGNQILVDVFQGAMQLLNDFIIGLASRSTFLGTVFGGSDPLRIVASGSFATSASSQVSIPLSYNVSVVPGPIAGAGLPALLALGGFVWARRRKASSTAV